MFYERMMAVRRADSRRSLRIGRLRNQNEPKPKQADEPHCFPSLDPSIADHFLGVGICGGAT